MKKKLIVIVEDEQDTRREVSSFLTSKGYECRCYASGATALEQFTPPVDLALIDMHLPGGNGIDLFSKLRIKQPDLPALLMTAFGDYQIWGKSLQKGFTDVIPKPFDFDELLKYVEFAIRDQPVKR